ncbi:transposase [Virgibacillus sp. C22-A2]|uniref:Transposase n=1 Tax=Virgibacillus tibetensis TaxID=3042313 RepID=A0ABU6KK59_9BACI|nr:transposase [Virgibacillus sp. C22-A2]
MAKAKTPSYTLTLRCKTQPFQEHVLEKRFEMARKLYNRYLGELLKRKKMMEHDSTYHHWIIQPKSKEKNAVLSELRKLYGLFFASIDAFATRCRKPFAKHIDSDTNSKLAKRACETVEKLLFNKDTQKVHFKKFGTMDSVEGKKQSGIRFVNQHLVWNGLHIAVVINKKDVYAHLALLDRLKYSRIQRRFVKGKVQYYVQLILEGFPPQKVEAKTGKPRNLINKGKVGLDIGTQTIAISSEQDVKLLELAPSVDNIEKEKRKLLRKLDRSRRITNPNKYNEDGTIKIGNNDKWVRSNNYMKVLFQYKELQRKVVDKRKQDHERLANAILSLGNEIKVETMNYKGLAKRSKETTINEKTGRYNRKKRLGKSIGNKAPSMLLRIIKQKLAYHGYTLFEVDTWTLKASQYNHVEDISTKKTLSKRWNVIDGKRVQRDMYSAYLLQHTVNEKEYDKQALHEHYQDFLELHDKEVERLRLNKKNVSSMGI